MADWFYDVNGQASAPVTKATLGAMLAGGQINRQTQVIRDGIQWTPLEDVAELRDILPAPAYTLMPSSATPNGMVRIPGGTFMMGSPESEPDRDENEGPQHQVTVSSFYMGKYEVTQKEYHELTLPRGDNPVEGVSWYDAVEYCNRLSQREGLTPAYTIDKTRKDPNNKEYDRYDKLKWLVTWNRNANGYRLPTEAEWEYACRAGTTTAYNTGANISNDNGWYKDNSGGTTHPVGQKPANRWGLYDMHGNVCEWCWDWRGDYTSGAQTDPRGASSGVTRVRRGGNWSDPAQYARSASRSNGTPCNQVSFVGFRLVRPAI